MKTENGLLLKTRNIKYKAMPEGPVIVIMKDNLQQFIGKKVSEAHGKAKFDQSVLEGKVLKDIRIFGKQTYLVFDGFAIRIHLLMFGSYSINEEARPEDRLHLSLIFKDSSVYFYTCNVRLVGLDLLKTIDWEADVMSDIWNPEKAMQKLKSNPEMMACDALMDQEIFSGVGNIIKNEALFRIAVQPESLLGHMPDDKLNDLITEARNYSFDFLKWKKDATLQQHWLAHTKKICPICGEKLVKKQTGLINRRSFFCETDQTLY